MADEKDPNTDDLEEKASVEDSPAEGSPAEDTPAEDTPAVEASAEAASGGEGSAEDILAEIPEDNQDGFDGNEDSGDGTHTARDLLDDLVDLSVKPG